MAKNFQYLFNQDSNDVVDIRDIANSQYAEEKDVTLQGYDDFLVHEKEAKSLTLMEGLEALGVFETTSTNGFPSLQVGDPDARVSLAKNTKSAINAILGMAAQKYRTLDPNYHLAWFDPRVDAQGILTVWNAGTQRWVVFDWINGAYAPSRSIVPASPGKPKTNGNTRYFYQAAKHQAIKDYLVSKDYGTSFLVVMNFEDDKSHYETRVRDRKEMTLSEVWEAIAQDWNDSNVKRQLTGNGSAKPTSLRLTAEREEFVKKLARFTTDYVITFKTAASSAEQTILFPASDPVQKAKALNNIRNARPTVEFVNIEKVEAS